MVDRFYGYQYDTNPRKLSQEHTPFKNRYPKKEEPVSNKNTSGNTMKKNNRNTKNTSYRDVRSTERITKVPARQNPEYRRKQVTKDNNNVKVKKVSNSNADIQNNAKARNNVKTKIKMVMFLITGFSVLFAISYQNSLISESFNKKEQYKKELEALSKTNQQIEVSIENNLNLKAIEQSAQERLGMKKLENNQKIYVSLPKQDYVAPAAEQITIEEETGFFEKLIKGFIKTGK